jgi:hypothetical protein
MNLTGLKWTKNVKDQAGRYWAYKDKAEYIEPAENIFCLNWKFHQYENACQPQTDDFIILRQHARVTHIVRVLDNELYKDLTATEFSLYRLVQAVWMAADWHNPPTCEQVFGQKIFFPRNGKVIDLENMNFFQEIWELKAGLLGFQNHVRQLLQIS